MEYKIGFEFAPLLAQIDALSDAMDQRIHEVIGHTAEHVFTTWASDVMHANGVWSKEKQEYVDSLQWRFNNKFEAVVWTDYELAAAIESGRPGRDLKRMLDTSLKVRIVANGKNAGRRFLVIPFRHNVPGNTAHAQAMPPHIHDLAKKMKKSKVVGQFYRPVGQQTNITPGYGMQAAAHQDYLHDRTQKTHLMVSGRSYKWGDRMPSGQAPKLSPHHHSDPYAGMVRMNTSSGKQKSSAYLTFRVMMEGSPKWVTRAKPGLYIARGVAQATQPLFESAMQQAVAWEFA